MGFLIDPDDAEQISMIMDDVVMLVAAFKGVPRKDLAKIMPAELIQIINAIGKGIKANQSLVFRMAEHGHEVATGGCVGDCINKAFLAMGFNPKDFKHKPCFVEHYERRGDDDVLVGFRDVVSGQVHYLESEHGLSDSEK